MARRSRGLQRALQAGATVVTVAVLGAGIFAVSAKGTDHATYGAAELAAQVATGMVPDEAGELLHQFRGTTAARQVGIGAVSSIAISGTTALVSGRSNQIAVLSLPDLKEIGRIPITKPSAQIAARNDHGFEFAVLDENQIKLFAGAEGEVPVHVDSISVPFVQNNPSHGFAGPPTISLTHSIASEPTFLTQSLFGPFIDDAGGITVVSSDLQILYWSPMSRETFGYDLQQDPMLAGSANTRLVAASGFGPLFGSELSDTLSPPTNEATGQPLIVATDRGEIFQIHLGQSDASDLSHTRPAPAWLSQWLGVGSGPGTTISSLSWSEDQLLVGTDNGLKIWPPHGPTGTEQPLTDLREEINTAAGMTPMYGPGRWTAVSTPSGVSLLSDEDRVDLGYGLSSSGASIRVGALASTSDGLLVVGRSDGLVFAITTTSAQASLPGATAMGVGPDGWLLTPQSYYSPIVASGLQAVELGSSQPSTKSYPLASSTVTYPVLTDITADGKRVLASGVLQGSDDGFLAVWDQPGSAPRLLTSSLSQPGVSATDFIAAVAYDRENQVVAGYYSRRGAVSFWSSRTWRPIGLVDLYQGRIDVGDVATVSEMSASADGSLLTVTAGKTTTLIETASQEIVSTFQSGRAFVAPDGESLAVPDDDMIKIIDQAGRPIRTIALDGFEPSAVAWTPDGRKIAFADPAAGEVGVIDVRTGELEGLPIVVPPSSAPLALLWATDEKLLIGLFTGSENQPSETLVVELADISWQRQLCALVPEPGGHQMSMSVRGAEVGCPGTTSAATTEHPRWSELDFAAIPSVCQLPAGRLAYGRTPWIATDRGGATRVGAFREEVSLTSQSTGTLAVLNCSAGGVEWPQTLVLYGPDNDLLSHLDLSTVPFPAHREGMQHVLVEQIDVNGIAVNIRLRTYDGAGLDTRTWHARLHIEENVMRINNVELVSGPDNSHEDLSN